MTTLDQELKECADTCLRCYSSCLETMSQCLEMGGEHAQRDHITLMQLCADICQVSARAMLLGASLHTETCRACAAICEACAEDCESMEADFMQECAVLCRECADSCWRMSGGTQGATRAA